MKGHEEGKRNDMKMKTRMRLTKISAGIFGALVVAFWLLILYVEMGYGPPDPAFAFTLLPLIAILATLVFFVRRQDKAAKAGIPLRDERTERIENRAGRYAMIGTLWFLLAMGFYQMFMEELGLPDIPVRYFIWIVFFVVLWLFAGFKFYFGRKGE